MSKGKGKNERKGKSSSADRSRPDTVRQPPASTPRKKSPRPPKAAEPPVEKPKRGRGRPVAEDLARRCTATSKTTGERCRQIPIPGGTVCKWHGGGSPQVQKSARGRLAELVMPAINTLNHEREHARRSSDRQRAANSILDRAGITRGHNAEIDAARALLLERLLTLRAEVGQPEPLVAIAQVIEDAVIVEEGDTFDRPEAEYDDTDDD